MLQFTILFKSVLVKMEDGMGITTSEETVVTCTVYDSCNVSLCNSVDNP